MNPTYYFGLLLVVFGGFLALNSTGQFSSIGIGALFVGFLVGILGVVRTGLAESN